MYGQEIDWEKWMKERHIKLKPVETENGKNHDQEEKNNGR